MENVPQPDSDVHINGYVNGKTHTTAATPSRTLTAYDVSLVLTATQYLLVAYKVPADLHTLVMAVVGASYGRDVEFSYYDIRMARRMFPYWRGTDRNLRKQLSRLRKKLLKWQAENGIVLVMCTPGKQERNRDTGVVTNVPSKWTCTMSETVAGVLDAALADPNFDALDATDPNFDANRDAIIQREAGRVAKLPKTVKDDRQTKTRTASAAQLRKTVLGVANRYIATAPHPGPAFLTLMEDLVTTHFSKTGMVETGVTPEDFAFLVFQWTTAVSENDSPQTTDSNEVDMGWGVK